MMHQVLLRLFIGSFGIWFLSRSLSNLREGVATFKPTVAGEFCLRADRFEKPIMYWTIVLLKLACGIFMLYGSVGVGEPLG